MRGRKPTLEEDDKVREQIVTKLTRKLLKTYLEYLQNCCSGFKSRELTNLNGFSMFLAFLCFLNFFFAVSGQNFRDKNDFHDSTS